MVISPAMPDRTQFSLHETGDLRDTRIVPDIEMSGCKWKVPPAPGEKCTAASHFSERTALF
jgi:hypothetical protein